MFKTNPRLPPGGHRASSAPDRLEEMITYAKLALQNVGGPGYDPYNSPAASGQAGGSSALQGTPKVPTGH